MQEGYGAKLIRTPELIKDIVRQTVSRVPGIPVSIKIRIHDDARYTVHIFLLCYNLILSLPLMPRPNEDESWHSH